jgi:flagellar hook protein FlgE
MTVTSSLAVGIAGMTANANAMSGVADNIANLNTAGYKRASTSFGSLVADQTGGDGRTGGVTSKTNSLISKQGLIQASANQTDLAIDGNGFFVTRSGSSASDPIAYSRSGSFTPDRDGYLRNSDGLYIQGWKLDASGNMSVAATLDTATPIQISELSGTAAPTSNFKINANLDSRAAGGSTFTTSFTYYDAQGKSRQLELVFTKLADVQAVPAVPASAGPPPVAAVPAVPFVSNANIWTCNLQDPASVPTTVATGTLTFDTNGTLKSVTGTINTATTAISIASVNAGSSPSTNAGSSPLKLDFGTLGQANGLRQFAESSVVVNASADGGFLRNISSVDVSPTGQLDVLFSDGTRRPFYQLPLATFRNADSLTALAGNAYVESPDSGSPTISDPGSLGAGSIKASSLEASNVDLAEEFSNMIRYQRAYSASSRIITTADEMLQEANNLKR